MKKLWLLAFFVFSSCVSKTSKIENFRNPSQTSGSELVFQKIENVQFSKDILSEAIAFEVPQNAISFVLSVAGEPNCANYLVNKLTSSENKILVDGGEDVDLDKLASGTNRTTLGITPGVSSILVPNRPSKRIASGTWSFQLAGCKDSKADVHIAFKIFKSVPKKGTLKLNFFLSGAHGWNAKNAKEQKDFTEMVEVANSIFSQANIDLQINSIDSLNPKFQSTPFADFSKIAMTGRRNDGINIFVIKKSPDLADGLSISLGVPGPVGLTPSAEAGILIFTNPHGRSLTSAHELGTFLAHELGHYLGLYHVSDSVNGPDQLSDTNINDELNLMNKAPFAFGSQLRLTPQQTQVLLTSPFVTNE